MRYDLPKQKDGTTAIEFAIVMPVALIMLFGTVAIGIGIWYSSLLKAVATEAARCLAIKSAPACTSNAPACGDTPGNCFVIALAGQRGFDKLAGNNISINPNSTTNGVASTEVTITYDYTLVGYSLTLNESATFPNF